MILHAQNLAILATIIVAPFLTTCAAEPTISADTPVPSLIASAKAARLQGQNSDALAYFGAAIERNPSDYLTFFQRGATYLAIGRNAQAKSDFDSALRIRPGFEGALLQRGKINARNAEWEAAKQDYKRAGSKAASDLADLEEAEGAYYLAFEADKKQDWESCVNNAGVAILTAGTALSLRQLRAKCRFERGEVQEGVSDLAHVLQINPGLIQPHLQMSSMMFYSLGDMDKAVAQLKKCLQSDPENTPCMRLMKEEKVLVKRLAKVGALMESKSYASASKLLVGTADEPGIVEAINKNTETAVSNEYMHTQAPRGLYGRYVEKTCEAFYLLGNMKKADQHCKHALEYDSTSLYGLLHKAAGQLDAENFDAAIATLNTAKEHHPQEQLIQKKLQEAQTLLKRSKSKDYYKVLGVSRDADERTIKRAWRQATKQHHPDKAAGKGVTKEEAERKMAGINEAYEVLSDPELKARFDRGEDPNDPMARQGGHPFEQGGNPFGGFGGQPFFFHQGPGGGGGGQRQFKFQAGGGGFPGGGGGFPFGM